MPTDSHDRIAFVISPELCARTEQAIAAIRQHPERKHHVRELIAVVDELTRVSLDYYFIHPLEEIGTGSVALGAARIGVAAARHGIHRVQRRLLSSMSSEQLLKIADFMDRILIRGGPK